MKCVNCGRTCVPDACHYCYKDYCVLCRELELHDCPYIQKEIETDMERLKDKCALCST